MSFAVSGVLRNVTFFGIVVIGILDSGKFVCANIRTDVVIAFDQSTGTSPGEFNRQKNIASYVMKDAPVSYSFAGVRYGESQLSFIYFPEIRRTEQNDALDVVRQFPFEDMGPRDNVDIFQYVNQIFPRSYKVNKILLFFSTSKEPPTRQLATSIKPMPMKIFIIGFGNGFEPGLWSYVASTPGKHVFWVKGVADLLSVRNGIIKQLREDAQFPCAVDEYLSDTGACKTCYSVCPPSDSTNVPMNQCRDKCPYLIHAPFPVNIPETELAFRNTTSTNGNVWTTRNTGIFIGIMSFVMIGSIIMTGIGIYFKKGCFKDCFFVTIHATQPSPEVYYRDADLDVRGELQLTTALTNNSFRD